MSKDLQIILNERDYMNEEIKKMELNLIKHKEYQQGLVREAERLIGRTWFQMNWVFYRKSMKEFVYEWGSNERSRIH